VQRVVQVLRGQVEPDQVTTANLAPWTVQRVRVPPRVHVHGILAEQRDPSLPLRRGVRIGDIAQQLGAQNFRRVVLTHASLVGH
jgi:hypothetical protein